MIANFKLFIDNNYKGSSHISPAHGRVGARARTKNSAAENSFRLREGVAEGSAMRESQVFFCG